MNYTIKLRHIAATGSLGAALVLGSATFAAEPESTLISCNDLLPEGVHYQLRIRAELKTGSGEEGVLTAQVTDATKPGSTEIPQGAGPYVRCLLGVIGEPDAELPEGL